MREDTGAATIGDFGPDFVMRAVELDLLELLLELLRVEGGAKLGRELCAVAAGRSQALDVNAAVPSNFISFSKQLSSTSLFFWPLRVVLSQTPASMLSREASPSINKIIDVSDEIKIATQKCPEFAHKNLLISCLASLRRPGMSTWRCP